jgi:hypothetical protein
LHWFPQPPQLKSSVCSTTQSFPHGVSFVAHLDTHLPCEQSSVVRQGAPHAPQLVASVFRSVQPFVHDVLPVGQTHSPPRQVMPWSHATAQPPQFLGLVDRSTHKPLQKVKEPSHESWQTPFKHDAPGGQW